jgi:Fur family peroxide stress response transcriptional regulator
MSPVQILGSGGPGAGGCCLPADGIARRCAEIPTRALAPVNHLTLAVSYAIILENLSLLAVFVHHTLYCAIVAPLSIKPMCDPDVRLQELIRILNERGHRLTPQRMAVLRILAYSDEHPSVQQIYDQVKPDFPMTSLGTIYKTVTLLKEMGEVVELGFGDDSNRYDGHRPYPHPHLVCLECKRIVDPDIPTLTALPEELGKSTGYQIVGHRLDFYGICPGCRAKGKGRHQQVTR